MLSYNNNNNNNYTFATKGYYNRKLFLLTAIDCSLITEKRPFSGWITATVVAKLTQIL